MEVFDATSQTIEVPVKKDSGEVIFEIASISIDSLEEVAKLEKELASKKLQTDPRKALELMVRMIKIMCPAVTEEHFEGIPIDKLVGLTGHISKMAFASRPDTVKKNQGSGKPRSSRSRRKASA